MAMVMRVLLRVLALSVLVLCVIGQYVSLLGVLPVTPLGEIKSNDFISNPPRDGCPRECVVAGADPKNWTHIHRVSELTDCQQPLLFDLNIQNSPTEFSTIRTCMLQPSSITGVHQRRERLHEHAEFHSRHTQAKARFTPISETCGVKMLSVNATIAVGPVNNIASNNWSDAASAADVLAAYLMNNASCGSTTLLAKYGAAIVGIHVGVDIDKSSAGSVVSGTFKEQLNKGVQTLQLCGPEMRGSQTIGIYAVETISDLGEVTKALQKWVNSECGQIEDGNRLFSEISMSQLPLSYTNSNNTQTYLKGQGGNSTDSSFKTWFSRSLTRRADCRAIQVVKDDSCAILATRCGIKGSEFAAFNTKANLCSTLMPKQWVCCTAGTLPDIKPKPDSAGVCAKYTVAAKDGCWSIGEAYGITEAYIESVNKNTWGWAGCSRLQIGQIICLSAGKSPMPAPITGVACGPQKPGTAAPSSDYTGFDLAKLNPCPLRSCCSSWGFCGTTEEFCTISRADTGAPGTSQPGKNGCLSNCGMTIVNNLTPPPSYNRIGYFQGYNKGRNCLHMDATNLNSDGLKYLTHVHFAFAGLTEAFGARFADDVQEQFDKWVAMDSTWKKIISFGGWADSTEPGTFQRYRDAVLPANREIFANNMVAFVKKYELDGIDFDWEYPGAPDLPEIPAGSIVEGTNYLEFLKLMRAKLPAEKSLSIALPASFWYLKPFPVEAMAPYLDYFIYMTYDIHGQWDYGNKFTNPGCPTGNCLRSHINQTETTNALVMITKAGVPASEVMVGLASYGRSFRMTDKSCTGPQCTFTGTARISNAEPGRCTGTGGYISNVETKEILLAAAEGEPGYEAQTEWDSKTNCDIMTFGTQGNGMTDWVSYMDAITRTNEVAWYKALNFGGTTDCALDLEDWYVDTEIKTSFEAVAVLECDITGWPNTLEELEAGIDNILPHCRAMATTRVLIHLAQIALQQYKAAQSSFDDLFGYYVDVVKDNVDGVLDEYMSTGKGKEFMDCEWYSSRSEGSGPCTEISLIVDHNNPGARAIKYTMRDEAGFFKALSEIHGIEKEWVQFTTHVVQGQSCICPKMPCMDSKCTGLDYVRLDNFPRRISDTNNINVPNPRKILDEALPNAQDLVDTAVLAYLEMSMGSLDAQDEDVAMALSMPVFMLNDAAESMERIKDIGAEEKERQKRELIINILSIVFSVLPFAGIAASAAMGGARAFARIALVIGEAGNAAITVAELVEDPLSAPFAIMGMFMGVAGMRANPKVGYSTAAGARRALSDEDLKLFSPEFLRKDTIVQNILKKCSI